MPTFVRRRNNFFGRPNERVPETKSPPEGGDHSTHRRSYSAGATFTRTRRRSPGS
jgi:hypothetical protein